MESMLACHCLGPSRLGASGRGRRRAVDLASAAIKPGQAAAVEALAPEAHGRAAHAQAVGDHGVLRAVVGR